MNCKTTVTLYAVSPGFNGVYAYAVAPCDPNRESTFLYGCWPEPNVTLYAVTPYDPEPGKIEWFPYKPAEPSTEEEIKKLKERIQKLEEVIKLKKQLKEKEEELQKDKLGYSITVSGSTSWTASNTDKEKK